MPAPTYTGVDRLQFTEMIDLTVLFRKHAFSIRKNVILNDDKYQLTVIILTSFGRVVLLIFCHCKTMWQKGTASMSSLPV